MKTKIIFASICAATLALGAANLTSCATDSGHNGPDNSARVNFTAGIENQTKPGALTRTTGGGDAWVAGDGVGIYMLQTGGTIPAGVLSAMTNKRYNVADAATGALTPDATTSPVIEYPASGVPVDFTAYYPHSDATDGRIDANGVFSVSLTDQSDPARIDVLTAKATGAISGPVALQFEHALSKVTINMKVAEDATTITAADVAAIADVKLAATPGSARVNVGTGAVTDGPNARIALLKAATAATDYDATFSAIVAPTSGQGDGRYVTIAFDGREIVWSLPTNDIFAAGEHYVYWGEINERGFRVNGSSIKPWSDSEQDEMAETTPAKLQGNYRITWDSATSRYVLTNDPTNGGLYFKFGGVVGIYTANGAVRTLPATDADTFNAPGDVAWDPTGAVTGTGSTGWATIPVYNKNETDYTNNLTITPESGYHSIANVKLGKGDPCRLVGLDLAKIKSTAADALTYADIDNGKWRLPTPAELTAFSGRVGNSSPYADHWTTLSGVNGGMFPNATTGDATTFLPAVGYRNTVEGYVQYQGVSGYTWSTSPFNATDGIFMSFHQTYLSPLNKHSNSYGFNVRCVAQ
jgi:hypothetical protein